MKFITYILLVSNQMYADQMFSNSNYRSIACAGFRNAVIALFVLLRVQLICRCTGSRVNTSFAPNDYGTPFITKPEKTGFPKRSVKLDFSF